MAFSVLEKKAKFTKYRCLAVILNLNELLKELTIQDIWTIFKVRVRALELERDESGEIKLRK